MREIRTISLWIPVLTIGSLAHTDRLVMDDPVRYDWGRGGGPVIKSGHYRGRKRRGTYRTGRDHWD